MVTLQRKAEVVEAELRMFGLRVKTELSNLILPFVRRGRHQHAILLRAAHNEETG